MTADLTVDAAVIGAGHNGLVAAIALARKGWDVCVLERAPVAGGAIRSEASTLPGFVHDSFSAFYGLLHASPVFDVLDLGARVEWARFDVPIAAAVAPHDVAAIQRSPDATAKRLNDDAESWRELCEWWTRIGSPFFAMSLAPIGEIRPTLRFARRTGIRRALPTAKELLAPLEQVARARFSTEAARALVASGATHSDVGIDAIGSMPLGVIIAMLGQFHGMPVPRGGAGKLAEALTTMLTDAGGTIRLGEAATTVVVERGRAIGVETASGAHVRARHAVLADTGPLALCRDLVGEEHLPGRFLDGLRRFRYGTGMFRVDLALDGRAPWADDRLADAGVIHLCGTLDDMARAAAEANRGDLPARPSVIVGQQSIVDDSRAPAGKHTLWIECQSPGAGWTEQRTAAFTERVLELIESHAPGLRERVLGSRVRTPADLHAENPNLVNGDPGGGSASFDQQLVFRPVPGWFRYRMPVRGLYLCSASAHPGGGVHGMCGWNAAHRALRDSWRPRGVIATAGSRRRAPRR